VQEPNVRYDIRGMTGANYVGDGCVADSSYIRICDSSV